MNHLDEGTIHAWLDGALDATQSRQVEAHVQQCATCSALVAEARGIMAAASRIMSALDDVPGNVIPRGAAAAPKGGAADGVTSIAARRDLRRGWRVTSWASAIAAVLVAAVVLSTSVRTAREVDFTQVRSREATARVDSSVGSTAAAETPAPQTLAADRAESPPAAVPAPAAPGRTEKTLQPSVTRASVTGTTGNAAGAAASRPLAQRTVAADAAAGAAVASEQRAARREMPVTDKATMAPAQDTTRLRTTSQTRMALESAVVTGLGAAEVQRFVGCYRVDVPREESAALTKTAVGAASGRGARAAAPSRAPAQAPPAPAAQLDFSGRGAVSMIRLDTALATGGNLVVARVPSDSITGSWRVVGDSVRLDLGGGRVLMLSEQQRITCPSP